MKKAFTMIELVFVIVILGILSAVALPKFAKTKVMADISKGRSDVAAIRSSILTEKQSRLIKGENDWITRANLDSSDGLFAGVMTYPIVNKENIDGKWGTATIGNGAYNFRVDGVNIPFTYYDSTENDTAKRGRFMCDRGTGTLTAINKICRRLVD